MRTARRLRPSCHHSSRLLARDKGNTAKPIAMRTISSVCEEIGGGVCVVLERWDFGRTIHLTLQLLPCCCNGQTHLSPTSNIGSYLDIATTTGDDPLQATHHIWIALQRSVVKCIDRCFGEDVLNNVIFGARVGLLEFSDGVIIKLVLDIIMVERATTLPF